MVDIIPMSCAHDIVHEKLVYKKSSMFLNISGASPCWCGLLGSNAVGIWSPADSVEDPKTWCGSSRPIVLAGLGVLLDTARSPAVVIPNGEAINSVARGEKRDGVSGTSCAARSIIGEPVIKPSLGVLLGSGEDGPDVVSSNRSLNGRGLGDSLGERLRNSGLVAARVGASGFGGVAILPSI